MQLGTNPTVLLRYENKLRIILWNLFIKLFHFLICVVFIWSNVFSCTTSVPMF